MAGPAEQELKRDPLRLLQICTVRELWVSLNGGTGGMPAGDLPALLHALEEQVGVCCSCSWSASHHVLHAPGEQVVRLNMPCI